MFRDTYADDEADSPGSSSSSSRLGTATNNTTTATAQKELFPSPTAGPAVDFFHAGERNLDIIPEDDTSVQAEAGGNPDTATDAIAEIAKNIEAVEGEIASLEAMLEAKRAAHKELRRKAAAQQGTTANAYKVRVLDAWTSFVDKLQDKTSEAIRSMTAKKDTAFTMSVDVVPTSLRDKKPSAARNRTEPSTTHDQSLEILE